MVGKIHSPEFMLLLCTTVRLLAGSSGQWQTKPPHNHSSLTSKYETDLVRGQADLLNRKVETPEHVCYEFYQSVP